MVLVAQKDYDQESILRRFHSNKGTFDYVPFINNSSLELLVFGSDLDAKVNFEMVAKIDKSCKKPTHIPGEEGGKNECQERV